ncbi:MAG: HD domain-containing protein [Ruminococcaceae bacterium]|nr:HD domain-containing protein [Oscillospiraceae bacterium]
MHHITIPENIIFILDRLEAQGYEAYLVGGCVRDQLMGKTPHDYDVTTSALPDAVVECFSDCHVIETGIKHGTVTVMSEGHPVEITTFRTDGEYLDNRRPENVRFVSDLRFDLSRRDFTVNAMAYSPQRGLIDLFGGAADIRAGIIRCVGEPEKRFHEDGLRIMRALRFASRLGFHIEENTAKAVHSCRELLSNIAAERIFVELKGLLVGAGAEKILMDYRDVIFGIIPELAPMDGFKQNNPHHIYDVWTHTVKALCSTIPDENIRLALLLHDSGKPDCHTTDEKGIDHFHGHPGKSIEIADTVLHRLRCDNTAKKEILTLIKYHDVRPSPYDVRVKKFIAALGEDLFRRLLLVKTADTKAQSPNMLEAKLDDLKLLEKLLEDMKSSKACMSIKELAVNGHDLIKIGVPEGKTMGVILERLFDMVCTEAIPNSREPLLSAACQIMNENQAKHID